jgi:hypothetical protein
LVAVMGTGFSGKSRMSGDVHVRFRERLGGKFPGATRLVVTSTSKEVLEPRVLPAIRRFMAERGLELAEEKTRITHLAEGFDFLGQNVRKYDGKLLIRPARRSIKSLLEKVRGIIKGNASATQEALIQQLNPVIRGWAMYHRHVVAKATFSLIDLHVWRLLWKWATRGHPTKGARWVKRRYFRTNGPRSWDFAKDLWPRQPYRDTTENISSATSCKDCNLNWLRWMPHVYSVYTI